MWLNSVKWFFIFFFVHQDTFFYCLVFDPTHKTLLADKGEIRVGSRYQADPPSVLKEGWFLSWHHVYLIHTITMLSTCLQVMCLFLLCLGSRHIKIHCMHMRTHVIRIVKIRAYSLVYEFGRFWYKTPFLWSCFYKRHKCNLKRHIMVCKTSHLDEYLRILYSCEIIFMKDIRRDCENVCCCSWNYTS
jgi:hypothetical protein